MHRRLALAFATVGLLVAPLACDVPPLFGNECVSDTDCEGAGRCVSDTCVPECYLDTDCGDAGVGAVCQFNRCLVPVVPADASLPDMSADASDAGDAGPDMAVGLDPQPVDQSVEAGPDAAPDLAVDAGADMAADLGRDAELDLAPDAAPDAAADLGPDAGADLGPDAAADMAPDAE